MSGAKSYFDLHANHHAYHKDPEVYSSLIHHLKKLKIVPEEKIRILDLGCGDGSFINSMIDSGMNADFVGSDLSSSMIHMAKDNLTGKGDVKLLLADGLKLPLNSATKFDLIHIDCVLHHLIGQTRARSQHLVNQMLDLLTKRLSYNGILVVEEMYYVSYLMPNITSSLIFYALKLLNFLHLDLSKILSVYHPGLEVNFFYDDQIEKMLERYGDTVSLIRKWPAKSVPKLYRLLFLKEFGYISFLVTAHRG